MSSTNRGGQRHPEDNPAYKHGFAQRGLLRSSEYHTWAGMNQRCHNTRTKLYAYYGARGISVAPEWRGPGGFEAFLAHVGMRPSKKHSIDRIDNNGNYQPGNVRWTSRREQMLNTRRSRVVEFNGEALPLKVWCERLGLSYKAVHLRITRRGWDAVKALSTPIAARTGAP